MKLTSRLAASAAFALALGAAGAAQASDQSDVIRDSIETAHHMRHDPSFDAARHMLRDARAILIVPALVKGGFVFGAEGGDGVLLARTRHGWSAPAFYTLGSASFGLQIGLEKAEVVMLIMSDRALRAIERSQVKIGADADITVVTLSAGAEGATAPNLTGDIVAWTSATGAYGGLTFNGSVIKSREEWDNDFYGRSVDVPEIMAGRINNPADDHLRAEVRGIW